MATLKELLQKAQGVHAQLKSSGGTEHAKTNPDSRAVIVPNMGGVIERLAGKGFDGDVSAAIRDVAMVVDLASITADSSVIRSKGCERGVSFDLRGALRRKAENPGLANVMEAAWCRSGLEVSVFPEGVSLRAHGWLASTGGEEVINGINRILNGLGDAERLRVAEGFLGLIETEVDRAINS